MITLVSSKGKRSQKERELALNTYGIHFETITNDNNQRKDRLLICLVRALLIFLAVYGTIGSLLSAFELPYNFFILFPSLLIICTLIAFLYYNKITFYAGYVFIFIVFTLTSISGYFYINSGFQAVINSIYSKYSDYFALDVLREATEYIDDRTLTVSLAMIFAGAFLAILLNITISGYMSIIETFLITFPILEIALYIDLQPNIIFIVMLFIVYIAVGLLNRSNHFKITSIKRSKDEFITLKNRTKKETTFIHSYISSGKGMLLVTIYSFIFTAIFLIATASIFYSNYDSRLLTNQLKATTDEYIKAYLQNGPWSFFDRYKSKGGLNNGQLGGVSRVTPDYQTDLTVTFVPVDTSTIYFKGFVGNKYTGNLFLEDNSIFSFNPNKAYNPSSKYSFSEYIHPTNNLAKMQIENIDLGPVDVLPYDSILYKYREQTYESHLIYNDTALNEKLPEASYMVNHKTPETDVTINDASNKLLTVIYDPYIPQKKYEKSEYVDETYEKFVYENYLDTPDYLDDCLEEICDESGIDKFNVKTSQEGRLEALKTLRSFYIDEFSYTMSPGSTPRGSDVIEHFLTKRRRGFCAHFASSSVLLLRYIGIPARYVEGYALQFSSINDDARAVTNNTDSWISDDFSYRLIDIDKLGVVTVDVTDGSAHAWVEVYIDGYGWIPYEFTPPSTDNMINNFSLGGLFAGLMRIGNQSDTSSNDNATNDINHVDFNFSVGKTFNFMVIPFICILLFTILALILITFAKSIIRTITIIIYEKKCQYGKALSLSFMSLMAYVKKDKSTDFTHFTVRDYEEYLINKLTNQDDNELLTKDEIEFFSLQVNKAFYSTNQIDEETYKKCSLILSKIKTALKKLK